MITTTLARIREHNPCENGWRKLLAYLGKTQADDEPIPYATIVESNGLDDALWCCRAEPGYDHVWREFALWCAWQVRHMMTDQRSLDALDIVRGYLDGRANEDELAAAWDAARAAAWAAAKDAVRATRAARDAAARAAARVAAEDAQCHKFLELVGGYQ